MPYRICWDEQIYDIDFQKPLIIQAGEPVPEHI